ncbi:IS200/IS605 family transposase [Planctomycetota bacterium]
MAQSLAKILVHIVFSTKGRQRFICEEIREELHAYLVGVLRNHDSPALLVNSVDDHVHILCRLSKNHAVRTIVEEVKKASSKWIKTKGEAFREFYWQSGYGAFSVSPSKVDSVKPYIADQKEHHRRMTFEEEFRKILQKHGIEYDERYVWD